MAENRREKRILHENLKTQYGIKYTAYFKHTYFKIFMELRSYTASHNYYHTSGFFSWIFRAVKRTQKLNLELSFETQSSHQSFSAVKMKLFELNS